MRRATRSVGLHVSARRIRILIRLALLSSSRSSRYYIRGDVRVAVRRRRSLLTLRPSGGRGAVRRRRRDHHRGPPPAPYLQAVHRAATKRVLADSVRRRSGSGRGRIGRIGNVAPSVLPPRGQGANPRPTITESTRKRRKSVLVVRFFVFIPSRSTRPF